MSDVQSPATAANFSYTKPVLDRNRAVVVLGRTDHMIGMVHVIKEGGEDNLHAHPHTDGLWMVLRGKARFYGENDVLRGEFGPHQGILLPRGTRYRFENASSEDLEILTLQAFSIPLNDIQAIMDDRINFTPMKTAPADVPRTEA